jgi:hypothetical protein
VPAVESFEDVLRARRRQHTVNFRPNGKRYALPRPVAWLDAIYFGVLFVATLAIDKLLHVVGLIEMVFHAESSWVLFHLVLPGALLWLANNAQFDGRKPHMWVWSYILFLLRPKRTLAGRTMSSKPIHYKSRVRFWWDELAPRLHHGWVIGGTISTLSGVRFTYSLRHRKPVVRPSHRHQPADHHAVAKRMEVKP